MLTPVLMSGLGAGTVFLIFGLLNITNAVFVMLGVKETKGVPLEDIPALFGGEEDSKAAPLTAA